MYVAQARIVLMPTERQRIEIADLGLDDFEHNGLALVVYINTERVYAKELVLLPGQTCPEHLHPPVNTAPATSIAARWLEETYTGDHQLELHPGEQIHHLS